MKVGLVVFWRIEVHDAVHAVDVNTTSRHVGSHEHVELVGSEVRQGLFTLALTKVTVNGGGVNALLLELLDETVGAALGAGEDNRLIESSAD